MKPIAILSLSFLLAYSSYYLAEANTPKFPIPVAQINQLKDTLVIPGERVGPITKNTSHQELTKFFGVSRLQDKKISGPEGIGEFAATRVNLGQERSFTVVWADEKRTKPATIRDFGSAWKTPEGIGIGTSLAELRKQLGEFKLYGLAWDYSGTIVLENTKLANYKGKLLLQVAAAPDAATKYPRQYQAVMGDSTFSSSNPNWQPLGITVQQMIVYLNESI
ncbi:hypothetical protein NIES2119_22805 [[Phormidium ambiguum] IAM M-71]|uniref:Uncharacterized protein n=1 Tax=[Phormidium ambiguum] IAM M-71 TaxID=454136 RepID=A0A1U7IAG5_9CYAN|nr:hypothetical protein [Phormidium ambiguum]OKH33582.1 hypothetical protein NIES2119_22805 [Phormidium ambiguum IAM M-71]